MACQWDKQDTDDPCSPCTIHQPFMKGQGWKPTARPTQVDLSTYTTARVALPHEGRIAQPVTSGRMTDGYKRAVMMTVLTAAKQPKKEHLEHCRTLQTSNTTSKKHATGDRTARPAINTH